MICFPNCKINLGLNVLHRREDGFHDLESVFLPVNWCDALEVIEAPPSAPAFTFSHSGLPIAGKQEDNLIYRAWQKMQSLYNLPNLVVHLHKHIPMGAGLGGGSADAAFFLKQLDQQFSLGVPQDLLLKLAAELGSDCPFFILNTPVLAEGRGEKLSPLTVDLSAFYILVVFPSIHSDTRFAFSQLTPQVPKVRVADIVSQPVSLWKNNLKNDFEGPVFSRFPQIGHLKSSLYECGAIYASMSGSGSAVFGIFDREPAFEAPENYSYYLQKPGAGIL